MWILSDLRLQTVESVSYRLDDLKSGVMKVSTSIRQVHDLENSRVALF